jgi:hypothetical protein
MSEYTPDLYEDDRATESLANAFVTFERVQKLKAKAANARIVADSMHEDIVARPSFGPYYGGSSFLIGMLARRLRSWHAQNLEQQVERLQTFDDEAHEQG